jgi:hypothetical protein
MTDECRNAPVVRSNRVSAHTLGNPDDATRTRDDDASR